MTPRLTTERLVLRGLGARDVDRLLTFDAANRAFLAPWEPARDEDYFTPERAVRSIRGDAAAAKRRDGYRWHLFLAGDSHTIVGSVSLSNIVRGVFLSCHLGYRLGEDWTGQGYMTEAVQGVLDYAFGPLGLHRVEANVLPRNQASRAVLRRLGFEEEGLCRTYLKINGVWEDHLRHVQFAPPS